MMTMPGPPPKGRSSTLLCLPLAQSRMFHRWISTRPALEGQLEQALRQVALEDLREQGQHVEAHGRQRRSSASALLASPAASAARRRPAAAASAASSNFVMYFLKQHRHLLRRQGADAQPVLDAVRLQRDAARRCS